MSDIDSNNKDLEEILLLRTIGDPHSARVHFDTWLKQHQIVASLLEKPRAFRATDALTVKTFLYAALIDMSFVRFSGNFHEAYDRTEALFTWASHNDLEHDFHLNFQRGLNALTIGRSVEALKWFQACVNHAPFAEFRRACRFNLLIAAENIGAFFPNDLQLLEGDLDVSTPANAAMRAQCQSLRLRYDLYASSIHLWTPAQWQKLDSGQALFLAAWLEQMPHFKLTQDRTEAAQKLLVENSSVFSAHYMLRTLTGVWSPDDRGLGIKLSDKLDRLYLWTWRWAAEPTEATWASLRPVLEDVLASLNDEPLHGFDMLLLRNSVLLLRVLCPHLSDLEDVLLHLHGTTTGFEYFKIESRFFETMLAFREGQKRRAESKSADLLRELTEKQWDHLPFVVLIRSTLATVETNPLSPELGRLCEYLKSMKQDDHHPEDHIVIDLHRGTMIFQDTSTSEQSLIQLLSLFEHKNEHLTALVVKRAFGRRDYDPTRDDRRLFRLLQSAKDFSGGALLFKKQQDKILCTREQGIAIHFIGSPLYAHAKLSVPRIRDQESPLPILDASDDAGSRWWTRAELEEWTRLPKATLLRRIKEWQASGLIEVKGTGKSTRYRLSKELTQQWGRAQ